MLYPYYISRGNDESLKISKTVYIHYIYDFRTTRFIKDM